MITRSHVFLGICLTLLFAVWLFPYQSMVDHEFHSFEDATGAQLTYQTQSAGPMGVQLRDFHLTMPSGIEVTLNSLVLHPSFGGMRANFSQGGVQSSFKYSGKVLSLDLDQVEFDSGTHELGKIRTTGNLTYDTNRKDGGGDVRMVVPKFQGPLPIDSLELGTNLNLVDHGQGIEVSAEVHSLAGQEFTGDGNIRITPQPGQPGRMSGTLAIRTPQIKKGTLRIEGTWRKPTWSVVNVSY
jgi:hypothetical protein